MVIASLVANVTDTVRHLITRVTAPSIGIVNVGVATGSVEMSRTRVETAGEENFNPKRTACWVKISADDILNVLIFPRKML